MGTAEGPRKHRWMIVVALAATGALGLTACGDDSDGGGSVEAYCSLNEELNEQEEAPTDAQLDEIVAAAPEEIKDAARTLADFFKENREDIFTTEPTEEVNQALEELDEFDTAECGETASGADAEGGDGATEE